MDQNKPLSGLRVVELSTFVAAPACTKVLADWGAEVIKVESGKGDSFRTFGPVFNVPATAGENPLFDLLNGGKRFVSLDIKKPEGLELLYRLLETADVFVTNNRDKALTKAGLDYDTLKAKFPRLIYAHLTGFGDVGPKKNNPGFDVVAFWAMTGFMADMSIQTEHSYPVGAPTGMGDVITSSMLSSALLGALYARQRTGKGDRVTVSLYGTSIWCNSVLITAAQQKYGYKFPKGRYDPGPTAYKTSDGEWIQTSILEYDRYFPALCRVLGVPEMAKDPRFKTQKTSLQPENKRYQIELFEKIYATKTADEWVRELSAADITVDKLAHFKDIPHDEQARQNGFIVEHAMPSGETCYLSRPSARFDSMETPPVSCAAHLGEDTAAVLKELGLSDAEISRLADEGVAMLK